MKQTIERQQTAKVRTMKKLKLDLGSKKHFERMPEILGDYIAFSDDGANLICNFTNDPDKPVIRVEKTDGILKIDCPEKYFFRALGVAIKNNNKKSFNIIEKPKFNELIFLLDCSRNGVINFDTFKTLTLRLALLGYTSVQLYTEDTLEIEGEPYFGHLRGRFSPRELRFMDEFAESVGIELVPYIQTLAHFDNIFLWPEYNKIWDIYNTILIGEDKTYELIEKIFRTLRSSLKTKKVNIGFDEAHFVLRGKYLDKNGYPANKFRIVSEHLKRVIAIAEKYDFRPSMWSDMFFRFVYDGYYQVEPNISSAPLKKIKKYVPDNVDLIYWDYYHDDKAFYDAMIKKHKVLDKNTQFACGIWKWLGYAPMNGYGIDRIIPGLKSAAANKIKDVLVTAWGDNGNEAPVFSSIPQIIAAAEYTYKGKYAINDAKKTSKALFFADFDDMMLLDIPNLINREGQKAENFNPSKYLLYNDPIYGLFDFHTDEECREHFEKCVSLIKNAAKRNPKYAYIFDMESALCDYLGVKANFGNTLRDLYMNEDKEGLKLFAEKTVPLALNKLDAFISALRKCWIKENKIFGFDVLEIRLGGQRQRLTEISFMIKDYIDGTRKSLPELEEKPLSFAYESETGRDVSRMHYAYMATPGFSLERY